MNRTRGRATRKPSDLEVAGQVSWNVVAARVFWGPHLLDVTAIKQTPVALVKREKEKSEYETDLLKL